MIAHRSGATAARSSTRRSRCGVIGGLLAEHGVKLRSIDCYRVTSGAGSRHGTERRFLKSHYAAAVTP